MYGDLIPKNLQKLPCILAIRHLESQLADPAITCRFPCLPHIPLD